MVPLLLQALPGLPPGTLHHTDEEKLLVFNSLLHVQQWGPFIALDEPNKTCSVISLGLMNKVESVREGLAILLCSAAVIVVPALHVSYGWGNHLHLSLALRMSHRNTELRALQCFPCMD